MPSDWQSDEYGQPPPSLDPYQDPEGEQYDATPRGSSSMLVPDMHQLSLDDYDYTQPPGNYHHGFPDQGNQYGDLGQSYAAEPSGAVPPSSGKGKGRTTTSGPSKQGGRSSRHSGHSSQKKPPSKASSSKDKASSSKDKASSSKDKASSSKDKGSSSKEKASSSKDKGPSSKAVNPGQGPGFQREQHLPFRPGEETTGPYTPGFEPTHQTPSYHALPPISESGPLFANDGLGDPWTGAGGYQLGQYGNEAAPTSNPYATAASTGQSAVSTIPRGPSNPGYSRRNKKSPYQVHHANEFVIGKVFKLLYCEPKGSQGPPVGINGSYATSMQMVEPSRNSFQSQSSWIWEGHRRFIVVRKYASHCLAIPIYTYGDQGCRKPGCKPEYHGIVHDARHKPEQLPGEPKPRIPPVRINLRSNQFLRNSSRANYFASTKIEYNLEVMFVGEVVRADLGKVNDAVDESYRAGLGDQGAPLVETEW